MNMDFSYVPNHYGPRTHEKMKEVLMDPYGIGPAFHYYMIRGGVNQKNITIWEPGTISGEYIKTYGHYHVGKLDETYWILFGQGVGLEQTLVMDKKGNMISDRVAEFKATLVKTGDSIYFAPGHGHLFANIGSTYFVTADNSPVNFEKKDEASLPGHADYNKVQEMQGFAYYLIEKDGKPAFVKNKKYKEYGTVDLGGIPLL